MAPLAALLPNLSTSKSDSGNIGTTTLSHLGRTSVLEVPTSAKVQGSRGHTLKQIPDGGCPTLSGGPTQGGTGPFEPLFDHQRQVKKKVPAQLSGEDVEVSSAYMTPSCQVEQTSVGNQEVGPQSMPGAPKMVQKSPPGSCQTDWTRFLPLAIVPRYPVQDLEPGRA